MSSDILDEGAEGVRQLWDAIDEDDHCGCTYCHADAVIRAISHHIMWGDCAICGLPSADQADHEECLQGGSISADQVEE